MATSEPSPISIRNTFSLDDWRELQSFFEEYYWPDVAIASPEYFSWQLGAGTGAANLATAWAGDRIVGTLGFSPRPAFWGNTDAPVDAAWLIAWMVHPGYRHGIGLALLKAAQQRYAHLLGIGAQTVSERIFERLGWATFPSVPRYIGVFDAPRAQAFALPDIAATEIRAALFQRRGLNPAALCREWIGEEYEPGWNRYEPLRFGTVRSREFLHWRYATHPVYRFRLLTLGDPDRPALCVYRIEQAADVADKVGRIIEFFHPSDDVGRRDGTSLLGVVLDEMADQGCAFADCVTSSEEYGFTLLEAGWTMERRDRQLLAVRLQPVERVPYERFNVEYGVPTGMLRPASGAMYVTRGDGDADRPRIVPRQRPSVH